MIHDVSCPPGSEHVILQCGKILQSLWDKLENKIIQINAFNSTPQGNQPDRMFKYEIGGLTKHDDNLISQYLKDNVAPRNKIIAHLDDILQKEIGRQSDPDNVWSLRTDGVDALLAENASDWDLEVDDLIEHFKIQNFPISGITQTYPTDESMTRVSALMRQNVTHLSAALSRWENPGT